MQAYDLLMLIVIAMATIFGAIKGFAWQVASLASILVSYFVAYQFRFDVAEMIQAKPPWNQFLAMLILYVGTSFVIWVGFRLFSGMIDKVRLREFDRHLGAGFGLAKGLIYCLLITMFAMSLLGPNQQAAICQSRSGYYISHALDRGVGILPKEIHSVVGPYLAGLDKKLKQHDGHIHDPGELANNQGDGADAWVDGLKDFGLNNLPNLPEGIRDAIPNLQQSLPGASQQPNGRWDAAFPDNQAGTPPSTNSPFLNGQGGGPMQFPSIPSTRTMPENNFQPGISPPSYPNTGNAFGGQSQPYDPRNLQPYNNSPTYPPNGSGLRPTGGQQAQQPSYNTPRY